MESKLTRKRQRQSEIGLDERINNRSETHFTLDMYLILQTLQDHFTNCVKNTNINWTAECETSFNKLKDALMSTPTLAYKKKWKQN